MEVHASSSGRQNQPKSVCISLIVSKRLPGISILGLLNKKRTNNCLPIISAVSDEWLEANYAQFLNNIFFRSLAGSKKSVVKYTTIIKEKCQHDLDICLILPCPFRSRFTYLHNIHGFQGRM